MTTAPTNVWLEVFPGPRIPDILAYVAETWNWLHQNLATTVAFHRDETELTDNLCEALEDADRRRVRGIDCDFQAETWELRRKADGSTTRIARADIRVILGAPGTPHLVIEFKKLDGTGDGRWRYCFDGMNRFVEGKYAVGHVHGVMCGFSPNDLAAEAGALATYIAQKEYARRLCCITNGTGQVVTVPSQVDPACVRFDTHHDRSGAGAGKPILLLHTLLPCPQPQQPRQRRKAKRRPTRNASKSAGSA
jgi:hypothetical protein